ncbi:hypothetical protein [Actinomadura macrotermitis]|uniref:DUF1049 domain-containing protein n=1 Tax=Actinomadura macrotermitis TaxID=2585200 RepID=A0A7K0BRG8_9ACTN|nr:hypothetical protein [Actinomadura macrotermitis]MQY03778.1 hypothetical protein [Actinomadura macrotermitis]
MSPKRWAALGWGLLAAAAVLAAVAMQQAFASISVTPVVESLVRLDRTQTTIDPAVLLRGVALGVLAGAAFFAALACFYWSAARRRQDLLEQILHRLLARDQEEARAR